MKERPVIFSGESIAALQRDIKTQTRRIIKPQPIVSAEHEAIIDEAWQSGFVDVACPYGEPGDGLWVRETFALLGDLRTIDPGVGALASGAFYRADYPAGLDHDDGTPLKWRSPLFMQRQYSRISLEVTGVRVERLQDISEADAKAEGAASRISPGGDLAGAFEDCDVPIGYRNHFRDLWHSINGVESWDANPLVWVVSFRRMRR